MNILQLIAYLATYPGEAEILIKFPDGTGGSLTPNDIQPLADPESRKVRWIMLTRDDVANKPA